MFLSDNDFYVLSGSYHCGHDVVFAFQKPSWPYNLASWSSWIHYFKVAIWRAKREFLRLQGEENVRNCLAPPYHGEILHSHKCPHCDTIWIHSSRCHGIVGAHMCPNCGTVQWKKFELHRSS